MTQLFGRTSIVASDVAPARPPVRQECLTVSCSRRHARLCARPNFRLSEQDSRDIATYLFSLTSPPSYPSASSMDDANMKERGRLLIKQYLHSIGFGRPLTPEEQQELTS